MNREIESLLIRMSLVRSALTAFVTLFVACVLALIITLVYDYEQSTVVAMSIATGVSAILLVISAVMSINLQLKANDAIAEQEYWDAMEEGNLTDAEIAEEVENLISMLLLTSRVETPTDIAFKVWESEFSGMFSWAYFKENYTQCPDCDVWSDQRCTCYA